MNVFQELQSKIGKAVGKPSIYERYKIDVSNKKVTYTDPDYVCYIMHKVYNIKHEFDRDNNLDTYFELKAGFPDVIAATGKTTVNFASFVEGKEIFTRLTDEERRNVMQFKSIIGFVETPAVMDFYKQYLDTSSDDNNFTDEDDEYDDDDD